jgi:uncharacterized protein
MVEWDRQKAKTNFVKHGVSFLEATTVLDDPYGLVLEDAVHSVNELRFLSVGYSDRHRILAVIYTERNNDIRIISARPATPSEQKMYEKGF